MKAGLVLLLLTVVLVAALAVQNMRSLLRPSLASAPVPAGALSAASSGMPPSANPLANQAREAVTKAMDDAESRREQAEKP